MTADEVFQILNTEGVALMIVDGKLRCRAEKGVIWPELREAMKEHRDELIRMVRYVRGSRCPHCGANNWRYEPLAFDQAGGHICMGCKRAFKA